MGKSTINSHFPLLFVCSPEGTHIMVNPMKLPPWGSIRHGDAAPRCWRTCGRWSSAWRTAPGPNRTVDVAPGYVLAMENDPFIDDVAI